MKLPVEKNTRDMFCETFCHYTSCTRLFQPHMTSYCCVCSLGGCLLVAWLFRFGFYIDSQPALVLNDGVMFRMDICDPCGCSAGSSDFICSKQADSQTSEKSGGYFSTGHVAPDVFFYGITPQRVWHPQDTSQENERMKPTPSPGLQNLRYTIRREPFLGGTGGQGLFPNPAASVGQA